jgi:hypothetical protein
MRDGGVAAEGVAAAEGVVEDAEGVVEDAVDSRGAE